MPIELSHLTSDSRPKALAWSLDGWSAQADESYRVTVVLGSETITYVVMPVGC